MRLQLGLPPMSSCRLPLNPPLLMHAHVLCSVRCYDGDGLPLPTCRAASAHPSLFPIPQLLCSTRCTMMGARWETTGSRCDPKQGTVQLPRRTFVQRSCCNRPRSPHGTRQLLGCAARMPRSS